MKRGIKHKEGENLSPSTIEKVIGLLNGEPPISKKEACQILNIAYNTTRLSRIIDEYEKQKEQRKQRRIARRLVPLSAGDKSTIIEGYLAGEPITELSETVAKSAAVVKAVLKDYGVPLRTTEEVIIPETALCQDYAKGDLVYSAKYKAVAEIDRVVQDTEEHGKVYKLYVGGEHEFTACQPWYELGSLVKAQKDLGLKVKWMSKDEVRELIISALTKNKEDK